MVLRHDDPPKRVVVFRAAVVLLAPRPSALSTPPGGKDRAGRSESCRRCQPRPSRRPARPVPAVCLPTTPPGLSDTVRAVQTLANRARRLEEALAAVRAELEPVLNGWLFVPPDGYRCLLCGEEAERRRGAGGVPSCGPCRSERCRRVREALAVARKGR